MEAQSHITSCVRNLHCKFIISCTSKLSSSRSLTTLHYPIHFSFSLLQIEKKIIGYCAYSAISHPEDVTVFCSKVSISLCFANLEACDTDHVKFPKAITVPIEITNTFLQSIFFNSFLLRMYWNTLNINQHC